MTTPDPSPFDRAIAAHAAREQARAITPPDGFAERVTAAVLAQPRWPKWAMGASAAVGVVLTLGIGYVVWPKAEPVVPPQPLIVTPEPTPPNIGDTLSEAGNALAKLSRDTTDKATPPPALFAPVEAVKLPPAKPMGVGAEVQPAADTLAAVPAAARSGFEPVTGRTRKAFNLLLRDTGLRN